MKIKPILIIHPRDKTTKFLNRIKYYLISRHSVKIHHFNIYANDTSHKQCIQRIKSHPNNGLIIFLGHGRSDKLYGSTGDLVEYSDFISQDAVNEDPHLYYNNENFITMDNIEIFTGKKVFCLACNSNKKIARVAVEKGASCFLGFGNMPTTHEEFISDGINDARKKTVKLVKSELNYSIKISLDYCLSKNQSFEQLYNILHLVINKRIAHYRLGKSYHKDKYFIADYLYYLKRDIILLGNKKLKLLSD